MEVNCDEFKRSEKVTAKLACMGLSCNGEKKLMRTLANMNVVG